jgi:hypothetical protein
MDLLVPVQPTAAPVEIGIVMKRLTSSALILAALILPAAARADTSTYAALSGEQTIHGMINSIDGKYGLTVRDDHVGLEGVTMHRGTIIDPIGLQLKPGMQVTITGHADGRTFDANEIDAPAEYLEAQNRTRSAESTIAPWTPLFVPNGRYQANGPTAEGGG